MRKDYIGGGNTLTDYNCKQAVSMCEDIGDFLSLLSDIGEESLTDFLLWKLKQKVMVPNYAVNLLERFNKKQEGKAGAGFYLKVYYVDRNTDEYLSLAIG